MQVTSPLDSPVRSPADAKGFALAPKPWDDVDEVLEDLFDDTEIDFDLEEELEDLTDMSLHPKLARAPTPALPTLPTLPPARALLLATTGLDTFEVDCDLLPRIAPSTLEGLLADESPDWDHVVVVDCRFGYEFDGGHVVSAVNLLTQLVLEDYFFGPLAHARQVHAPLARTLYVFHCEFLVFRGPLMATHLRALDRRHNTDHYPFLSYPDVVVLDGGYKRFRERAPHRCGGYVLMNDVQYEHHCAVLMHRARLEAKLIKRAKLYHHFSASGSAGNGHSRLRSYTAAAIPLVPSDKVVKKQRLIKQLLAQLLQLLLTAPLRRPPPTPFFGDVTLPTRDRRRSQALVLLMDELEYEQPCRLKLARLVGCFTQQFTFPRQPASGTPSLSAKLSRTRLVLLLTPFMQGLLPMLLPFLLAVDPLELGKCPLLFIDPINDTPVDFSVPVSHKRTSSALTSMLYSFVEE